MGDIAGSMNRAVANRWCVNKGHLWSELRVIERGRRVLELERRCTRCGLTERHTAQESIAGTDKPNPLSSRKAWPSEAA